jgi:hypothetical protein
MKKIILIFVTIISLTSCDNKVTDSVENANKKTENIDDNRIKEGLSNPAFMYGTDFGNLFKVFYAQGKFDEMLKFTSDVSINKHGKTKILDFYRNDFKFGYEIGKPHSQTTEGDTITLNYNANIIATKRVIRISVVVENDTCKVVLPENLNDFLK